MKTSQAIALLHEIMRCHGDVPLVAIEPHTLKFRPLVFIRKGNGSFWAAPDDDDAPRVKEPPFET